MARANMKLSTKFNTIEPAARPFALDLTNDGALLAIAEVGQGRSAPVQVFRTSDRSLMGEFGVGFAGCGVAFDDAAQCLYYVIEEGGQYHLCRGDLATGKSERLATFPSQAVCQSLARDAEGKTLAVAGRYGYVWDTQANQELHRLEAPEGRFIQMAISPRRRLLAYGHQPGHAVEYEVPDWTEKTRWLAPRQFGKQIAISPKGNYLVLVADGVAGVFVYDMRSGERALPAGYHESSLTGLFAFSPDESLLVSLAGNALLGEHLPSGTFLEGPEFPYRHHAAIAAARDVPIVALAWDEGYVALVPLSIE